MTLITRTNDALGFHTLLADPLAGNGTPGDAGDILFRIDVRQVYMNTDGTPTGWVQFLFTDNLPTAFPSWTTGAVVAPAFTVGVDHPGGAVEAGVTLPARTNGWRLVDAYVRSRGGSAGTFTLLDATAGNAMTDAMVPGAANAITRAASLIQAEETVAGGGIPVWSGTAGTPATTCFALWVGL